MKSREEETDTCYWVRSKMCRRVEDNGGGVVGGLVVVDVRLTYRTIAASVRQVEPSAKRARHSSFRRVILADIGLDILSTPVVIEVSHVHVAVSFVWVSFHLEILWPTCRQCSL